MMSRGAARSDFLAALIGAPWSWRDHNCWDFAAHVQRHLFCRELPAIAVPVDLSQRWVLRTIETHPARHGWREIPPGAFDTILARDGALVLMAHRRLAAHIGVWLLPEARIIHCSDPHGVVCETALALRQMGWRHLTFFEPKT